MKKWLLGCLLATPLIQAQRLKRITDKLTGPHLCIGGACGFLGLSLYSYRKSTLTDEELVHRVKLYDQVSKHYKPLCELPKKLHEHHMKLYREDNRALSKQSLGLALCLFFISCLVR